MVNMCTKSTISKHPSTTENALKLFCPGQRFSLKPLNPDLPDVTFTTLKLSTPVTKSVVVLAKPDAGEPEQVVIKIFDPRFLDERITHLPSCASYPWNLSTERSAAEARPENSTMSDDELVDEIWSDNPEDLSGEDLAAHNILWEERYYRLTMASYDAERRAYERLKDLQGSAIPRLVMAGTFLAPDERAIQPPALVLEYIPSVSLLDVPFDHVTPDICAQILSAIESFPSHGVIHNDITLTNIRFTPPDKPMRGFVIDFGCAVLRQEDENEVSWKKQGESDVQWARRLLEDTDFRKSWANMPNSGFQ